jgi:hypothetical protein
MFKRILVAAVMVVAALAAGASAASAHSASTLPVISPDPVVIVDR